MAENLSISNNGNTARLTGKGIGNKTSVSLPNQPKTKVSHVQILGRHQTNDKHLIATQTIESLSVLLDEAKSERQVLLGQYMELGGKWISIDEKSFNILHDTEYPSYDERTLQALKEVADSVKSNPKLYPIVLQYKQTRIEYRKIDSEIKKIKLEIAELRKQQQK